MFTTKGITKSILEAAHHHAKANGGCKKVDVGSCLVLRNGRMLYGANTTLPYSCRAVGCRRIELYGEDSKNHRLPEDCRAVHSEIDVITTAARVGEETRGATIYVTRYPCEACARAIVKAGIIAAVYGRQQEISAETALILRQGGVKIIWEKEWDAEDTTR